MNKQATYAIILAGGLGTRLQSIISDVPKCMAPINGKPFLSFIIQHLSAQGISNFILSTGYKHEVIFDFIKTEYSAISSSFQFSIEQEPLGTGGAILLACERTNQQNVLIFNGDTLFMINLQKLLKLHLGNKADCTVALKPMQNFDRYGVVDIDSDKAILNFDEKKWYDKGFINGGIYALNAKKFLNEGLPSKFSFEKDYLEKYFDKRKMYGDVQDEYFIDIGIPEDYKRAQKDLRNTK